LKDLVIVKRVVSVLGFFFALFYFYTSGFGIFSTTSNLAVFLLFTSTLLFLTKPMRKGKANTWWMDVIDMILMIAMAWSLIYWWVEFPEFAMRRIGMPNQMDLIAGFVCIVISLEVTRRVLGMILPAIGIGMLIIMQYAQFLPGILHHRGIPPRVWISYIYFSEGIFSVVTSTFAVFVMPFLVFGAFLKHSGGGEFFIRFCTGVAGRIAGGPAMVAVLGSGILGSITGSPMANVMSTGQFTIPLMKRVGYSGEYAAAVEASSSVGGAFLPPIMGAGAFILAANVGVPYAYVMAAALIPSLLYLVAVGAQVYWYAKRRGLEGMEKHEVPDWWAELKKGWYYFGAIAVLIIGIFVGYSVPRVAFFGCIFLFLCSFIRKETRFIDFTDFNSKSAGGLVLVVGSIAAFLIANNFGQEMLGFGILGGGLIVGIVLCVASKEFRAALVRLFGKVYKTFEGGGLDSLYIGATAGTMGIVMGGITLHGMGLSFANALLGVAGDNLFILMILVTILGLVLGIGLNITAAYILMAIMAAPALIGFGLDPLVAHMICFWLSLTSNLCPPMAVAAICAAGIAKADPIKTAFYASMLGIFVYVMPFSMAYAPQIMAHGTGVEIATIVFFYIFIIVALASMTQGWLFRRLAIWERIIMLACIVLMLHTHIISNLAGLSLLAVFAIIFFLGKKRGGTAAPPPAAA